MASLPELDYRPKTGEAVVGDLVSALLRDIVAPKKSRLDAVIAAWADVVPLGLREHCRVKSLSGSQLRVTVDSSVYMYELQICSGELVKELKKRCPEAAIRAVKLTLL